MLEGKVSLNQDTYTLNEAFEITDDNSNMFLYQLRMKKHLMVQTTLLHIMVIVNGVDCLNH